MNGGIDPTWGGAAVAAVVLLTLAISTWGLRISRTTSDFFVASRRVRARTNASAIGGEYVSAASFLGVAGLVLAFGAEMLWYPVGWTAGYLVLLALVAAPLRRSGAYTLPDFAEARLVSPTVRAACALLVVAIGWLYLVPQFQGAGITLAAVTGAPTWLGGPVVALVVLVGVASGGMRSITVVQAFQYWLKLTALLAPLAVLVVVWAGDGRPLPADLDEGAGDATWSTPFGGGLAGLADGPVGLYLTYSVIVATFLGAMGLPHVVVRFYTNPDGRAARRTTLGVLGLLGLFYLLPPVYGALGRVYDTDAGPDGADTMVLRLPGLMTDGTLADVLTAVITAGAFAAFLSTSSGLTIAVAGVLSQAVTRGVPRGSTRRPDPVTAFRVGAVLAATVPCAAALAAPGLPVARSVGLAFAVAASTFCPLLLLGIWWRGLTDVGALAGLVAGGAGSGVGVVAALVVDPASVGWGAALLTQPAAWSVPLAFAVMVGVSLATARRVPPGVDRFMVRLHTPEDVELDRG
ncbi:cation acetate symporter [Nocardioides zeae]|uniref:Cation acetate symporter n=1 Tax=Nocardioides imazamoxiresistens TaxID=3231893 RepID=A0ABU3PZR4_9ACTN|nr:cation acetate symporter [Nocardioides zeae]MDT9594746.1 cation acetate symporter [Nocardioides zeae]